MPTIQPPDRQRGLDHVSRVLGFRPGRVAQAQGGMPELPMNEDGCFYSGLSSDQAPSNAGFAGADN